MNQDVETKNILPQYCSSNSCPSYREQQQTKAEIKIEPGG